MTTYLIAAVCLIPGLVLAYCYGHRCGVEEHRLAMQKAAEEWRRCWLGDPVRASQAPKESPNGKA